MNVRCSWTVSENQETRRIHKSGMVSIYQVFPKHHSLLFSFIKPQLLLPASRQPEVLQLCCRSVCGLYTHFAFSFGYCDHHLFYYSSKVDVLCILAVFICPCILLFFCSSVQQIKIPYIRKLWERQLGKYERERLWSAYLQFIVDCNADKQKQ